MVTAVTRATHLATEPPASSLAGGSVRARAAGWRAAWEGLCVVADILHYAVPMFVLIMVLAPMG